MSNVVDLPGKGNHPSSDNDNTARLCRPLDLAEAEQAAWLAFRISRRAFRRTRSLADEIVMIEARDRWAIAFRRVERYEAAA